MRRKILVQSVVGLAGLAAFVGAGWAIGSATATHHSAEPTAASAATAAHQGLQRVPLLQVESPNAGKAATLTYEAPPGATAPTDAPPTPPQPAPTAPSDPSAQAQVWLPAPSGSGASGSTNPSGSSPTTAPTAPTSPTSPSTEGAPSTTVAAPSGTSGGTTAGTAPGSPSAPGGFPAPATPADIAARGLIPQITLPGGALPQFMDLCAADNPPASCPRGVSGTVFVSDSAFAILRAEPVQERACGTLSLDRDHYPLAITSNAPGDFTIDQRSDQTGRATHLTVSTSAAEARRWADHGSSGVAVTCLTMPVAAGDSTFSLHLHGVRAGTHDTLGAELDIQVSPPISEHPPVLFRPVDGLNGLVIAGSADDERVEAVLVRRPTGTTTSACSSLDSGPASVGLHPQALTDQAGGGFFALSPFMGTPFPRAHAFAVQLPQADTYDLCLTWSHDVAPHAEVTGREAFELQPPAHPSVHIDAGTVEVHQPRPGANVPLTDLQGAVVGVADGTGRALCPDVDVAVPNADTVRLCALESTGGIPMVQFSAHGEYRADSGTRSGAPFTGALSLDQVPCAAAATCTDTLWLPLYVPGSSSSSMGRVQILLTYTNPPAGLTGADWVWEPSGGFGSAGAARPTDDTHPQLDLSATRFVYDPADPLHLTVHWKTTGPARGRVELLPETANQVSCRAALGPGEVPRSGGRSDQADQGDDTFEVCPGERYSVRIRLENRATHEVTWVLGRNAVVPAGEPAGYETAHWSDAHFVTPPVTIEVTFGAKARLGGITDGIPQFPGDTGQPPLAHIDWWIDIAGHEFSQSRRSGFIVQNSPTCAAFTAFDLAQGALGTQPIRLHVGARFSVHALAMYSLYDRCRDLTSESIGAPRSEDWGEISPTIPVGDLLTLGRVQAVQPQTTGVPNVTCTQCEVWLTVDIRGHQVP